MKDRLSRGVQNLIKMSDISFPKTKLNQPRNSKKNKTSFFTVRFSKTDFDSLGIVFYAVSFITGLPT